MSLPASSTTAGKKPLRTETVFVCRYFIFKKIETISNDVRTLLHTMVINCNRTTTEIKNREKKRQKSKSEIEFAMLCNNPPNCLVTLL